jgi:quinol monooxygenase YgiN
VEKFGLYGKLIASEGKRDELTGILLDAAHSMKELKECEIYLVSISENDSDSVFVYEVWSNEEAHKASLSLEVTQTLIQKAKPIITGMERISTLIPKGGKGILTL